MLAGAYSFNSEWNPAPLAQKLAQNAKRFSTWQSLKAWDDKQFSCFSIQNNDGGIKSHHFSSKHYEIFMYGVLPNPMLTAQELCRKIDSGDGSHSDILEGMWVAVIYDRTTASLYFVTDQLGAVWLYVGIFQRGVLFCNDFGALVSNYPNSLEIDWDSVLSTLALNYVPNNNTLFHNVKILPPAQVVKATKGELKPILKFAKASFGDKYFSIPMEKKFELLDSIWGNSRQIWCTQSSRPVIPLSSGYDSRYILAELSQGQNPIRCLTFGHPRSADVLGAKSICNTQGIPWGHYSPPTIDWDSWIRNVEILGVTGGFQYISGWADVWLGLLKEQGDCIFLGFLGDALSGKHLVQSGGSQAQDWAKNWEEWCVSGGWFSDRAGSFFREGIKDKMQLAFRESWEELLQNARGGSPHHLAMHLDVRGRQRRFVAAQLNLIGYFSIPSSPFLTHGHFDFWFNVPFEDLRDQNLYKAYAHSRFPQLFQPEKAPTIFQRVIGTGKNFVADVIPGAKDFLLPSELNEGKMMLTQREEIVRLVEQVSPLLEQIFRVAPLLEQIRKFPQTPSLNAIQLSRLINLSIILRLGISSYKPGI